MKKNVEEMILLYNFEEKRAKEIKQLLESLKIKVKVLDKDAHEQKVGFLFELKGFGEYKADSVEDFAFGYELMMFNNFTRARLDTVLKTMRSSGVEVPICKSIVTPMNRFWSIRRVCQAMEKEHLAMNKDR